MEVEVSSETLVPIYLITWRHVPEDSNLHCLTALCYSGRHAFVLTLRVRSCKFYDFKKGSNVKYFLIQNEFLLKRDKYGHQKLQSGSITKKDATWTAINNTI
jgi:hypothetical protein